MKLVDKIKNALFEEEYVEVVEKPKPIKEKKIKKEKKNLKDIDIIKQKGRERAIEDEVKETPIAKKIVNPEKKQPIVDEFDLEDAISERNNLKGNSDFRFPDILEDDYVVKPAEPEIIKPVEKEEKEEKPLYKGAKIDKNKYEINSSVTTEHEYGAYEKKRDKTYFKPSPVISPIYGVIDKEYKEEEITPRREIRLQSNSFEHLDLDEVRNRAYGRSFQNTEIDKDDQEPPTINDMNFEDNNDLLDLTNTETTPAVSKVTVGDAEEYFHDLGLEYNNDYVDSSKEKATGRRVKSNVENILNTNNVKETEKSDDESLFDLIDSMYDKE